MYKPFSDPNSLTMGRSPMFGPLSTATGTSVPVPHSKLMASPITAISKVNFQRNIDVNINQGRKIIVPSPEHFPDEDSNDIWEEESIVRENNAKRGRNTSNSSFVNEPIAKRQKIADKEYFQTHQQTQNKNKQQSQQITQNQEKNAPGTQQCPNKFTTGFDDFDFYRNPAGAGIDVDSVCSECGIVCTTRAGWAAHQNAHECVGVNCAFCPQVFLTHHGRDAHQELHRDGYFLDVDDHCECLLCGGRFVAVMYLELHLLEFHGRESLQDPGALHLGPPPKGGHYPIEHDTQQLFRCGVCSKVFTYSLNLDCHMAIHTEVSYACALCDADYLSLDPLVSHSRIHRCSTNNPVSTQSKKLAAQSHKHHGVPPTIPMWGPSNQLNITHMQMGGTASLGIPANTGGYSPAINGNMAMDHAMVNYCKMMSSHFGYNYNVSNDSYPGMNNGGVPVSYFAPGLSNSAHQPMWPNYLNSPSLTHLFNYFNPYLLNNVNNINQAPSSRCSGSNNNSAIDKKFTAENFPSLVDEILST